MASALRKLALHGPARHAVGIQKAISILTWGNPGIEEHVHGHGWFGRGTTSTIPSLGRFVCAFYSRIMLLVPARQVFGSRKLSCGRGKKRARSSRMPNAKQFAHHAADKSTTVTFAVRKSDVTSDHGSQFFRFGNTDRHIVHGSRHRLQFKGGFC
jgi:hypothetical protein